MGFVMIYFGGGGGASPFPQPLFSLSICSWGCLVEGSASSGAPTPSFPNLWALAETTQNETVLGKEVSKEGLSSSSTPC